MASSGTGPAVDEVVIRPCRGLVPIDFGELGRYRDLLWFLVRRDVSLRYRQTVLGAAWAVLQPVLSMALFALGEAVPARRQTQSSSRPGID